MNKWKAIWSLIWSRNWLVINDRHSSASVRNMFLESFTSEMGRMETKLRKGYIAFLEELNRKD